VDLPPGPRLAVLLESIDQFAVDADELELVLRARARQIWHLQAELLVDLFLTARAVRQRIGVAPAEWRRRQTCEYVGWRLGWSARWAQAQLDLADALLTRFPDVFAAVSEGRLDPARAKAFVELLSDVDDEATVRWIVDRLLPKAPGWTLAELRERLRYHVQRRAPQAARRRYRQRVVERDVRLRPEPDGTASLAGVGLPAHRAAAAFDRIDRLARAARAAGDPRTLSQLRGDAFTDLLAGVPFPISPTVDGLTADAESPYPQPSTDQHRRPGATGGDPGPVPPETTDVIDEYDYERWFGHTDDDQRWVDQHWADQCWPGQHGSGHDRSDAAYPSTAADAGPGTPSPTGRTRGSSADPDSRLETGNPAGQATAAAPTVGGCATGGRVGAVAVSDGVAAAGGREPGEQVRKPVATSMAADSRSEAGNPVGRVALRAGDSRFGTGNSAGGVLAGDRCGRCGGRLVPRPGVVQVSVKLTTLLGRDDHPGLLAGFGPVPADVARQIAADRLLDPLWRWSVFDPHGELLHHGTTSRRPILPPVPHDPKTAAQSDSGSVAGTPDPACTCLRVEVGKRRSVVEIQLTPADLTTGHDPAWAAVIADIAAQVDADARANPPDKWSQVDEHGRPRHHGHTGRHPTADEAAFIRSRDRTCRAPHCRRPAAACDIDHALEHHRGGPSHRGNCRCLCRRHHTLRHAPGVRVTDQQTTRGRVTTWTLPDGRTYHVTRDKDIILTTDDDQANTMTGPAGED